VTSSVSGQSTSVAASNTSSNNNNNSSTVNGSLKIQTSAEHVELAELEEKEKLLLKSECELITTTRVIKGRFELTNKVNWFFKFI